MSDIAAYLAEVARRSAMDVGRYLRDVFRTDMTVDTKVSFHDPVTVHDKKVERRLHELLGNAVPGSHVLGEETGEHVLEAKGKPLRNVIRDATIDDPDNVRWIIDPIDGTANFACGRDYFCTSIAVEYRGKLVASAIYVPFSRQLFWADDDNAWYEHGDKLVRMSAKGPREECKAVIDWYPSFVTNNQHYLDKAVASTSVVYRTYATVRTPGAVALDLAYVAAGFTGAASATRTKPWDVAAGFHLVKTAGGKVWTFRIDDEHPDHLQGAFVACGPALEPDTALEGISDIVDCMPRVI